MFVGEGFLFGGGGGDWFFLGVGGWLLGFLLLMGVGSVDVCGGGVLFGGDVCVSSVVEDDLKNVDVVVEVRKD